MDEDLHVEIVPKAPAPDPDREHERDRILLDEAIGILKVIHSRVGLFLAQIDQQGRR